MSNRKVVGIVCLLCLFLLTQFACVQRTRAVASGTTSAFLISPTSELVSVNDNFTVTVNLTNAQNLFGLQVILKYNESGLKLNDMWVPEDSVFAGHRTDVVHSRNTPDNVGACLFDHDFVDVSNGVVCQANFVALSAGQWSIEVAVGAYYSFWLNTALAEEDPLGSNCTVFAVNETVSTGKIGTILPLNSTSFLGLENFTVSSVSPVSSLSFDPSISELSFQVNASAADIDALTYGTLVNITVPVSIFQNASLLCTVNADGKYDAYLTFAPSTLGLFDLLQGSHVVTLDIGYIDPLSTVPEFPLPTILLPLVMLALLAAIVPRRRMFKTITSR